MISVVQCRLCADEHNGRLVPNWIIAEQSIIHGAFVVQPGLAANSFSILSADWYSLSGERDRGHGANVAFADGHVGFKKWQQLGRKRISSATRPLNNQDRADLKWGLRYPTSPSPLSELSPPLNILKNLCALCVLCVR